jgi:glycosyltransferase involved in cell wall biosynthesis
MRVLHVNDGDRGGSIIAMTRLHGGLKKAGVDSKILNRRTFDDPDTTAIPRSSLVARLESYVQKFTSPLGLNDVHCLSTFAINDMDVYSRADLLNLHTIHGGFFNYLALPKLTTSKPAVFTIHDMWALTGHCSVSFDCDRWKSGCGRCPYPDAPPRIRMDNTRLEWKLKDWVYKHSNLTIVTPSKWLTEQVHESMLGHLPVHCIPHGIDMDVYRPLDRDACRAMLGIEPGKKALMFSAHTMNQSHPHSFLKGSDLLGEVLRGLPQATKNDCVLLLIGAGGTALAHGVGIQAVNLGYVNSPQLQAIAYSAADLFLTPTRAETFGLTILESMACGTPIVSFHVGPVPELVRPGISGYLAAREDVEGFRRGIQELLEDPALRSRMRHACREIAVNEYSLELQVRRYMNVYQELLQPAAGASRVLTDAS